MTDPHAQRQIRGASDVSEGGKAQMAPSTFDHLFFFLERVTDRIRRPGQFA